MNRVPSSDDLYVAAEWLGVYEGDEGMEGGNDERDACRRVQAWLIQRADAQVASAVFRQVCKEAGVPVSVVRKAIKGRVNGG